MRGEARRNQQCRGRRGFTLIEALVAIAISLALTGALFTYLFDVIQTRNAVVGEVAKERAAATLLDRIETELMTCVVGDARTGAGVKGSGNSLRILFRGVTVSGGDSNRGGGASEDLQISEYRFLADTREVKGHRETWRAELGGVHFEPLGVRIGRMRFRYFDGRQWRSSFDSVKSNALPRAVEVSLWLGGDDESADTSSDEERPADRVRVVAIPDSDNSQSGNAGLAEMRGRG
ncbi:MAG TPA: prepilin-type N-terminal cleavage/methylation domain-containing protein [Phycisphaerales bacterium]|nr:prepilin-type N-terminal cleavage/methylation domain-containing protein [Phycisphaerales bacterium]